jgi:uncharacterized protein YciI
MQLESYAFVLLRRGPSAAGFTDDELEQLQDAHLGHLAAMAEAGKLVAAGPFSDQPDASLRGLCFYACPVDEARRLAGADPAVRAGRLAVEVMTWSTRAGSVTFRRA